MYKAGPGWVCGVGPCVRMLGRATYIHSPRKETSGNKHPPCLQSLLVTDQSILHHSSSEVVFETPYENEHICVLCLISGPRTPALTSSSSKKREIRGKGSLPAARACCAHLSSPPDRGRAGPPNRIKCKPGFGLSRLYLAVISPS